jgi:proteasome accessory factor A
LEDPVKAIRDISRDPQLKKRVRLEDGRELTALEIQMIYWERAQAYVAAMGSAADETTKELVDYWGYVLETLATNPSALSRELDWVIKRNLMESFVERKHCGWDDPRVALMDLQYHDVKRNRGLYYLLERQNLVERLATEDDIQEAMSLPPQTTRAKVRGDFIKFAKDKNRSYTVDWTYLKLNGYWEETILCMDPFASSNKRVEELIAGVAASHR